MLQLRRRTSTPDTTSSNRHLEQASDLMIAVERLPNWESAWAPKRALALAPSEATSTSSSRMVVPDTLL